MLPHNIIEGWNISPLKSSHFAFQVLHDTWYTRQELLQTFIVQTSQPMYKSLSRICLCIHMEVFVEGKHIYEVHTHNKNTGVALKHVEL